MPPTLQEEEDDETEDVEEKDDDDEEAQRLYSPYMIDFVAKLGKEIYHGDEFGHQTSLGIMSSTLMSSALAYSIGQRKSSIRRLIS